jgi:hypothetical protein
MVWPRAVLTTVSPGASSARAGNQRRKIEAGELPRLVPEQDLCRAVRVAHASVRRHDQHGVAHAVDQDAEVVAGNRRSRECLAHALECVLDWRDLANAARCDRGRVLPAADPLCSTHQRPDRAIDASDQSPRDPSGDKRQDQPRGYHQFEPAPGYSHNLGERGGQQYADHDDR